MSCRRKLLLPPQLCFFSAPKSHSIQHTGPLKKKKCILGFTSSPVSPHVSDSNPDGSRESGSWRGALQHVLWGGRTHFESGGGSPPRLPQQLQRLVETEQPAAQPGQRGLCKRTVGAVLRQGSGSAYCLFLQSPPNHWALLPRSHQSCCPSAVSHHCGCVDGPPRC